MQKPSRPINTTLKVLFIGLWKAQHSWRGLTCRPGEMESDRVWQRRETARSSMNALYMLMEARDAGEPFDLIVACPDPALGKDFSLMIKLAHRWGIHTPGVLIGSGTCELHVEIAGTLGFTLVTDEDAFSKAIRNGVDVIRLPMARPA